VNRASRDAPGRGRRDRREPQHAARGCASVSSAWRPGRRITRGERGERPLPGDRGSCPGRQLLGRRDDHPHVLGIGLREHAVPEVEISALLDRSSAYAGGGTGGAGLGAGAYLWQPTDGGIVAWTRRRRARCADRRAGRGLWITVPAGGAERLAPGPGLAPGRGLQQAERNDERVIRKPLRLCAKQLFVAQLLSWRSISMSNGEQHVVAGCDWAGIVALISSECCWEYEAFASCERLCIADEVQAVRVLDICRVLRHANVPNVALRHRQRRRRPSSCYPSSHFVDALPCFSRNTLQAGRLASTSLVTTGGSSRTVSMSARLISARSPSCRTGSASPIAARGCFSATNAATAVQRPARIAVAPRPALVVRGIILVLESFASSPSEREWKPVVRPRCAA